MTELSKKFAERIKSYFSLERFRTVEDIRRAEARGARGFWLEPDGKDAVQGDRLEWAHHFQTHADLVVFDFELGTVGLVFCFDEQLAAKPSSDETQAIKSVVDKHISRAAYLRHLFLTEDELAPGEEAAKEDWPLCVELVFVVHPEHAEEYRAAIGNALRSEATRVDFLPDIGIGYVDDLQEDATLRRAMPWLLKATRDWLTQRSPEDESTVEWESFLGLRSILLDEYRLPKERLLTLRPSTPRVHVIHGPNGSGKSAFAEALEFIATGRISRLADSVPARTTYLDTIRHPAAPEDKRPSVRLNAQPRDEVGRSPWEEKEEAYRLPDSEEEGHDLERPSGRRAFLEDPMSFRMNQADIDELYGSSPARRAERFLQAFFPGERKARLANETRESLHAQIREDFGELTPVLKKGATLLRQLGTWVAPAAGKGTGRPFQEVLDEWLESMALVDIGHRALSTQLDVKAARKLGWTIPVGWKGLLPMGRPGDLAKRLDQLESRCRELDSELLGAADGPASRRKTPTLPPKDREALDEVGWLCTEKDSDPLGATIQEALSNEHSVRQPWGIVGGKKGWANPLLERIRWLLDSSSMEGMTGELPAWLPVHGRLGSIRSTVQEIQSFDIQTFVETWSGSGLPEAVNELMALFSPARWGYRDLRIEIVKDEDGEELRFVLGDDPKRHAELIFNTAQLTSLALALFLLNAPAQKNPFRLMLLDDPLQNLDEMSVSALARGLHRLVRIAGYAEGWNLLILAHSQRSCERIAREVPCHQYRMPWLTPNHEQQEPCSLVTCTKEGPGSGKLRSITWILSETRN